MADRLLVIRHGESEGNAARILQGHTDTELTELGRLQAARTARALANDSIERVIASPLRRASETASIIADHLGLEVEHERMLAEYDFGKASGKSIADLRIEFADLFENAVEGRLPVFPGEEGRPDFHQRVADAFRALGEHTGTTLVVAHGGVVGAMCHVAVGMDYIHGGRFACANCSITEFRRAPNGGLVLQRTNDTCHLEGEETLLDLG